MNCPRIAKLIGTVGFWVIRRRRHFLPDNGVAAERRMIDGLFSGAFHQGRLSKMTDVEIAAIVRHHEAFQFEFGGEAEVIANEIVFRLDRAKGGDTDYD